MQSQYTVDRGSPTVLTPPREVKVEQHRVLFFTSPQLSLSEHTLVIENRGEQFFFDYLQFDTSDESASTTSSPIEPPSSAPASSAINSIVTSVASQHESARPPTTPSGQTTSPLTSAPLRTSAQSHNVIGQEASTSERGSSTDLESGTPPETVTQETPATGFASVNNHLTMSGDPASTSSAKTAVPSGDHTVVRAGVIGGLTIAAMVIILGATTCGICLYRQRQRQRKSSLFAALGGSLTTAVICMFLLKKSGREVDDKSDANAERRDRTMQRGVDGNDMGPIEDLAVEWAMEAREGSREARLCSKGGHRGSLVELSDQDNPVEAVVTDRAMDGVRRRSVDGGIRLAVGPLELGDSDTASISTLPPEYELHT